MLIARHSSASGGRHQTASRTMKLHPPIAPPLSPAHEAASSKLAKNSHLMTVNEATKFLHCHRITLLRLSQRGRLPVFKTGNTWSFERAGISALANRNLAAYPHLTVVRPAK
jgi:excisionase family DNA binding protein